MRDLYIGEFPTDMTPREAQEHLARMKPTRPASTEPVDALAEAVDDAWVKLPAEWTRETFVQSVTANILDSIAKRGGRIVFDGVQP